MRDIWTRVGYSGWVSGKVIYESLDMVLTLELLEWGMECAAYGYWTMN
jgi:hypothetical protein